MDQLLQALKQRPPPSEKVGYTVRVPDKEKDQMNVKINIKKDFFDRDAFFQKLKVKDNQAPEELPGPPEGLPEGPPEGPPESDKSPTILLVNREKTNETYMIKRDEPEPPLLAEGSPGQFEMYNRMIPEKTESLLEASPFYLNNRKAFVNFMNERVTSIINKEGRNENVTCDKTAKRKQFGLMPHQKIVQEYLQTYSPYRGLLLYHGLGSGKTCSSIAIAEGLKSDKQILVLTPASLRMNYVEELKHCGDIFFKKRQHWIFVRTDNNDRLEELFSKRFNLPQPFIRKKRGVWVMDQEKESNYNTLTVKDKISLERQLETMIAHKYEFFHYNGLRQSKLNLLTNKGQVNPFSNKVVIIDEAHNFISRIVNKLPKSRKQITKKKVLPLSVQLYRYLMSAENCRIVFLSGTPMINYPNEIAVMFNILRGYIKTYTFELQVNNYDKVDANYFKSIFTPLISLDYMNYVAQTNTLTITMNPFGFENDKQMKVMNKERNEDISFEEQVEVILKERNIEIKNKNIQNHVALPDDLETFKSYFIDSNTNTFVNPNRFKRRILGLVSYFRSAQEKLMPRFNPATDIELVKTPMSNEQFNIYNEIRHMERKQEGNKKPGKKDDDDESSTYRIFSRLACNFVFPSEIKRPLPKANKSIEDNIVKDMDEDDIDGKDVLEKIEGSDGRLQLEDAKDILDKQESDVDKSYKERIEEALRLLYEGKERILSKTALQTYSPKFLNMLNRLDQNGLHLIYSQFRTLEGIGIFRLVLLANGYAEFNIANNKIITSEEDMKKPLFVLYTGTETKEDKEIIRNVFNGTWEYIPFTMRKQLEKIASNNMNGEIIRIFMITSSGAEGISLKNVKHVHIMEPYWHPVREEQVIGRARRICSHEELPEQERFVRVYKYIMTFTKEQLEAEHSNELLAKDTSKIDKLTPLSTDEALDEISSIKKNTMDSILDALKEASIDCVVHASSEGKQCFSFGNSNAHEFVYTPDYTKEEPDSSDNLNAQIVDFTVQKMTLGGREYITHILNDESLVTHEVVRDKEAKAFKLIPKYNQEEAEPLRKVYKIRGKIIEEDVYDNEAYKNGNIVKIGKLLFTSNGKMKIEKI